MDASKAVSAPLAILLAAGLCLQPLSVLATEGQEELMQRLQGGEDTPPEIVEGRDKDIAHPIRGQRLGLRNVKEVGFRGQGLRKGPPADIVARMEEDKNNAPSAPRHENNLERHSKAEALDRLSKKPNFGRKLQLLKEEGVPIEQFFERHNAKGLLDKIKSDQSRGKGRTGMRLPELDDLYKGIAALQWFNPFQATPAHAQDLGLLLNRANWWSSSSPYGNIMFRGLYQDSTYFGPFENSYWKVLTTYGARQPIGGSTTKPLAQCNFIAPSDGWYLLDFSGYVYGAVDIVYQDGTVLESFPAYETVFPVLVNLAEGYHTIYFVINDSWGYFYDLEISAIN